MRFACLAARILTLSLVLVLGVVLVAAAQDAPADQPPAAAEPAPAQPPKPAKKRFRPAPAPRPAPKAGEVIPLDQAPAEPAPAPAPAAIKTAPPAQPVAAPDVQPEASPAPAAPAPAPVVPPQPARVPAKAKAPVQPEAAPAAQPAEEAPAHPRKAPPMPSRPKVSGGKVILGALLPLSGPLAPQGKSSKVAIDLAVADINAYLAESESPVRVSLHVEDTESDGAKALERLKALSVAGARLVIGPYSDNEVDAVLDFANKNGIILLSQGSAGPYLAKPGRNLFRFSPSDAFQAEALAVLANQEGCTHLVTIWEGDMYGDELITHVKGQFANLGGQIIAGTRFKPGTTQFASFVADLKSQIDKQVKDKKKLAIVVAARGSQTAGILREASKLGGLDEAKWYGGDDSALRGAIVEDQDVAKFAAKVRMAFARYGETGTTQYSELEKRIEDRIHAFVDTQAVVAYDVVWLAAYSAMASGDDAVALKRAIPATAEHFYGASGWMALNQVGDRREDYDFDFWTIKNISGKYYWVKTARYQFDPGSVKQLIINSPEKE